MNVHLPLAAIAGSAHGEMGKTVTKGMSRKLETTFGELIALHADGLASKSAGERVDSQSATSTEPSKPHEETTLAAGLPGADTHASVTPSSLPANSSHAGAKSAPALSQTVKAIVGEAGAGKGETAILLPAGDSSPAVPVETQDKATAHGKASAHDPLRASSKPEVPAAGFSANAQILPVPSAVPERGNPPVNAPHENRTTNASIAPVKYVPASIPREKDTSTVTNTVASGSSQERQNLEMKPDAGEIRTGAHGMIGETASHEGVSPTTGATDQKSATTVTDSSDSRQVANNLLPQANQAVKPEAGFISQNSAAATAVSVVPVATSSAGSHLAAMQQVQPAAPSPYQRLDQVSAPAPVMLHASANRVSVGVHDPSLGWIEVKTQAVAGQISASLVTAAGQAHQSLSAQLPSLTQFLADHQVKVGDVVVQQGGAGGEMSSGSGQRHQQEAGRQGAAASQAESHTVLPESTEALSDERPLSYISIRA
ncbi:flagellar hook-length control protein FliK [Silvibacterium acidisoli]|uniref:flagellar hook-length control protein FliK n=1 Tax=Acidobacteriaceae bacterium ZG23-2 TaxID=2883246 RepID=UPI00406BF933